MENFEDKPVSKERAKELFIKMHEEVNMASQIVDNKDETDVEAGTMINTGAGAMHSWEEEKEKQEDERRRRLAA